MSDRLFLRRIQGDVKDLNKNRAEFVQAIQDSDNIKIFYFMLRPLDEPYVGGLYMGRIELPDEYPKKAGSFYMLTPNGRFTINTKICLTNSSYHGESWTPSWSIRNMILGVASIFITDDTTGISHIKDTPQNRKEFAKNSVEFNIKNYFEIFTRFNFYVNPDGTVKSNEEVLKIVNEKKIKSKETEDVLETKLETKLEKAEAEIIEIVKPIETMATEIINDINDIKLVEESSQKIITNVSIKKAILIAEEEKPKKVTKRVVKPKEEVNPVDEKQEDEKQEDEKPKKITKRVVKPKEKLNPVDDKSVDKKQEDEKPEDDKQEEKPKKVTKRVVKKLIE